CLHLTPSPRSQTARTPGDDCQPVAWSTTGSACEIRAVNLTSARTSCSALQTPRPSHPVSRGTVFDGHTVPGSSPTALHPPQGGVPARRETLPPARINPRG